MRIALRIAILVITFAALPAGAHEVPPPAKTPVLLSAKDYKAYQAAFQQAKAKHHQRARSIAAKASNPLLAKVIDWLDFTKPGSKSNFEAAAKFLEQNPDWPKQRALQINIEKSMPRNLPDRRVLSWFNTHPPVTTEGSVRFAEALQRAGQKATATDLLRRAWIEGNFTRSKETAFHKRHRELLRQQDETARLDRLLWDRRARPAKRQAQRIDKKGYLALALARLALMQKSGGVDGAIQRVPAALRNDPGLIFERARWRQRKRRYDGVVELIDPPIPGAPQAERWWPLRRWTARQAFVEGDLSVAYRVASGHGLAQGTGFAEGEWLAGWIALRSLRQPETALSHFAKLYEGVKSPISKARGAYWAGEAARAIGDRETATKWHAKAAVHGTTFYGQLARYRLGQSLAGALPALPSPTADQRTQFQKKELVQIVRLLGELDQDEIQKPFLFHLSAAAENATDYMLTAELARAEKHPDIAVKTAKSARQAGIILVGDLFPSLTLTKAEVPEAALVHAVVRQESAFNPDAVSHAGARGLMQLMPATAKRVARSMKVKYSRKNLTKDPAYNIRLGSRFLKSLITRYDGSYVLALAAYNAGPSRADRWIREYGDPRKADVDVIDWIESIPFSETRNYVQRIVEGLVIYRQRLGETGNGPVVEPSSHQPPVYRAENKDDSCCL